MFSSTLIAVTSILALSGSTIAQTIDPNSVPIATRDAWCTAQTSSCPLICLQQPGATGTNENSCDADSLSYSCVCNNNVTPNTTQYTLTIPYFECTQSNQQCVSNCPSSDSACQSNCNTQNPCGAQQPYKGNATASSLLASISSAAATSTSSGGSGSTQTFNGFGGATTTGSSSAAGPVTFETGYPYGFATVALCIFAGFAIFI